MKMIINKILITKNKMTNRFLQLILKSKRNLMEQNEYLKLLADCSARDYRFLRMYEDAMDKEIELRDEANRLAVNIN